MLSYADVSYKKVDFYPTGTELAPCADSDSKYTIKWDCYIPVSEHGFGTAYSFDEQSVSNLRRIGNKVVRRVCTCISVPEFHPREN